MIMIMIIIIIIIFLFLSEGMNIWNAFQVSYVDCLSKTKPILSVMIHALYGAVCFNSPISLVMIVRICIFVIVIMKLVV